MPLVASGCSCSPSHSSNPRLQTRRAVRTPLPRWEQRPSSLGGLHAQPPYQGTSRAQQVLSPPRRQAGAPGALGIKASGWLHGKWDTSPGLGLGPGRQRSTADLLTNSLRASRTFPEPVSSKICTVYPLEGLRPPTVALGVLVLSITSCSESPAVGMGGWRGRESG